MKVQELITYKTAYRSNLYHHNHDLVDSKWTVEWKENKKLHEYAHNNNSCLCIIISWGTIFLVCTTLSWEERLKYDTYCNAVVFFFSLFSFKIQYLLVLLLAHIHAVSECYPVPLVIYPLLYPIITATFSLRVLSFRDLVARQHPCTALLLPMIPRPFHPKEGVPLVWHHNDIIQNKVYRYWRVSPEELVKWSQRCNLHHKHDGVANTDTCRRRERETDRRLWLPPVDLGYHRSSPKSLTMLGWSRLAMASASLKISDWHVKMKGHEG